MDQKTTNKAKAASGGRETGKKRREGEGGDKEQPAIAPVHPSSTAHAEVDQRQGRKRSSQRTEEGEVRTGNAHTLAPGLTHAYIEN